MSTPCLPHLLWGALEGGDRRPRVLLGCSGSVATIKVPAIVEQLEQRGAHVIVVPTRSALHFLMAATDAVAQDAPVTVAAARVEVTEVDCASPNVHTRQENAGDTDRVIGKSEGINLLESENSDNYSHSECAFKQSDEENCFGQDNAVKGSKVQGSADRERVHKKYSASVGEFKCTATQCCAVAFDCRSTSRTNPLIVKDSSDCEQYSSNCNVELGKLSSSKTVQTQTEIAGVDCQLKDGWNLPSFSTSNMEHDVSVPSQCLSCLNILEIGAVGSFKLKTERIIHGRSSWSKKPPSNTKLSVATEGGSSQPKPDDEDRVPSSSCAWCAIQRLLPELVIVGDTLEWEGWRGRGDPVLHIELRRWADVAVIAPLSANTLAKLANGLCDNLLTCVTRAWDTNKPLLFCPAMNTHMYNHPLTGKQITALSEFGYVEVPAVSKRLICGDVGGGAMAEVGTIVEAVWRALQL